MDAARRQILLDALRALLLLPVFLALWYVAGTAAALVPAKVALPIVRIVSGGTTTMAAHERNPVYRIKLEMPYRPGGVPRIEAEVEVAAAKYTYGIALFLALAFAARESRKALGIVAGTAILFVLPAFGIAFDVLKQLGATAGFAPFLRWHSGTREFVALGYQAGALLLPTLAPIAAWLILIRERWAAQPIAPAGPAT